jgi:hypothetical protein
MLERNPMYVSNVGMPFHLWVRFDTWTSSTHTGEKPYVYKQCSKAFVCFRTTWKHSHWRETSCVQPSLITIPFNSMKRFTLGRNPVLISNVGKPFLLWVKFKDMNKVILEKIPGINNVGKSSLITGTFKDINRIILERNTMYVCNVGKPCLSNFQRYEGTHWGEFFFFLQWWGLNSGPALSYSTSPFLWWVFSR